MHLYLLRLFAFVLDWIVLFAAVVAPQIAIMAVTGRWFLDENSSNVLTWGWVGVSITLPSLAYFTLCDRSRRGMTAGKRLLKIRVRPEIGDRVSLRHALLRNVAKLVPWELTHIMIYFPEPFGDEDPGPDKVALMVLSSAAMAVWLIAPATDRPRYRAIHDRVARTRVMSSGITASPPHPLGGSGVNAGRL